METKGSSSNHYKFKAQPHCLLDCLEGFDDTDDTYEQLLNTRFSDMKKVKLLSFTIGLLILSSSTYNFAFSFPQFTPSAAIHGMQLTGSLSTAAATPPLCPYPLCRPLATSTPFRIPSPMMGFKAFSPRSDVADTSLEAQVQNDSTAPDVLESNPDVVKEQSNAKVETTPVNVELKRSCEEEQSTKIDRFKKIKYESVLTMHQLRSKQTAL